MNQIVTTGIVLGRINYGEADRILTIITPDHGKLRLMAKGVRRVKSKLASGVELFNVSQITFIPGKRDIGTLVSTRLVQHFSNIVKDIERVQTGYELIKLLNKNTEDDAGEEYYNLLRQAVHALDDLSIPNDLLQTWFAAQMLRIGGMTPNLQTDAAGKKLEAEAAYSMDLDASTLKLEEQGVFGKNQIKFLRLLFSDVSPAVINKVSDVDDLLESTKPVVMYWQQSYIG